MAKVIFICIQDTVHAGKKYLKGQPMDPEDPIPQVGSFWSIWQGEELPPPSTGSLRWIPQPERARAPNPTPEQLEEERTDPYGLKRRAAEARVAPPASPPEPPKVEKRVEPIAPFKQTPEEIADPFGLKARAAEETTARAIPEDPAETDPEKK